MANDHKHLRLYGLVLSFFAGLLFSGCAGFYASAMLQKTGGIPSRFELDAVPFFPQKADQCGPAALAESLRWSGVSITPENLTHEVFTPEKKGSFQTALIGAARRNGRIAYVLSGPGDLFREVAAGNPVIVLLNLGLSWYPVWHYAVVIGYDLVEKRVVLRSGDTAREVLSFWVFENTWARSHHWGIIILRPDQFPAVVKEDVFTEAVLGLEKARRFEDAVVGYQTVLTRWPDNLPALMGVGNCYYALGKLEDAETAFRKTTRLHPESGSAFNNLAQILFEQGRKKEALAAARKAVSLGGPLRPAYQKTLREIQSE
jgi:Tetratricopeptide repeat/Peptidase_C39 like family